MRNWRDFSLAAYEELLRTILACTYWILPFNEYLAQRKNVGRTVILRHDVDRNPSRARQMAEIEKRLEVRGTYFFRKMRVGFPESEILAVRAQGHEIGYHYEDLSTAKGGVATARTMFSANLEKIRDLSSVSTICMHGSPLSRFDNRTMWQDQDYREFGIIGEPYFDIDFNKVLYLTDTGRRWDGKGVSIRDKVVSSQESVVSREEKDRRQKTEVRGNEAIKRPKLRSTQDIINALRRGELPEQIMLTIHPQRWTDEWGPWLWELGSQNVKNCVKRFLVRGKR